MGGAGPRPLSPSSNTRVSLPSLRQLLAGDHDLHGPPCTPSPPEETRVPSCACTHSHKDGHWSLPQTSGLAGVRSPESIEVEVSGKCWQARYSRRSQGPRGGGSPPRPSPSQGRTSNRGDHVESRHSLRREEGHAGMGRHWALQLPVRMCPGLGKGGGQIARA